MKRYIAVGALLMLAVVAKADTGFLDSLPADDFSAAGLQKLTPDERARLEALVLRFKTGEGPAARPQVEAKAAIAQPEAGQKTVAAAPKAQAAEAETKDTSIGAKEVSTNAAQPAKKPPGWFAALITLNRASKKANNEEPLESRLVGDFSGWSGRSIFKLENGSRWVQQNRSDSYVYSPALHSPKVKITPAAISGFWLEIEGVNLSVRVVPLELTEQK